jgi:hypothetical protein
MESISVMKDWVREWSAEAYTLVMEKDRSVVVEDRVVVS